MIEASDFDRLRAGAFVVVLRLAAVAGSSLHIEADAQDYHSFGDLHLGRAGNFEVQGDYPDASRPACCQDVAWACPASYSFFVVVCRAGLVRPGRP